MKELVPHSPAWEAEFQAESAAIAMALGDTASTIHHIGSTSIAGIYAKAIVDILVEVDAVTSVDSKNSAMGQLGYECMGEYGICGRRYFRRVSAEGVRTHHVHMFNIGSEHVLRHLAFRDYLIAHPIVAREYSALKQTLAATHGDDWGSYLDGKEPFIKRTEKIALEWIQMMPDRM